MQTLQQQTDRLNAEGCPSWYRGDHGRWLVCLAVTRDDDYISRSNFRVMVRKLERIAQDCHRVERFSHWACGWVDYLLIDPDCAEAVTAGEEAIQEISTYPILDESDASEIEEEDARTVWEECYDRRDRVEFIRENRHDHNEPASLSQVKAAIRGDFDSLYGIVDSGYVIEIGHC